MKNPSYKFFRVISIPHKERAKIKFNSSVLAIMAFLMALTSRESFNLLLNIYFLPFYIFQITFKCSALFSSVLEEHVQWDESNDFLFAQCILIPMIIAQKFLRCCSYKKMLKKFKNFFHSISLHFSSH